MNNEWWIKLLREAAPDLGFDAIEAEDESVDDSLQLDGTNVSVQLGDGYVAVNKELFDEDGNFIGIEDFGMWDYNPSSIPQIVAKLRTFERFKQ